MKVVFVVPVGKRAWLRIYWNSPEGECSGGRGYHNAMKRVVDGAVDDELIGGIVEDWPPDAWPTSCEVCGAAVPALDPNAPKCECGCGKPVWNAPNAPQYQVFKKTLYAPPDNSLAPDDVKPGQCFYADWYHHGDGNQFCHHGWTNCDGKHLIVVTPDDHQWDTNGRASNCDQKLDTTHRCWVVHGTPEAGNLHVDKVGLTCGAGAGSIDTGRWHGFLHNGELKPC